MSISANKKDHIYGKDLRSNRVVMKRKRSSLPIDFFKILVLNRKHFNSKQHDKIHSYITINNRDKHVENIMDS